jgi:hypothetical protein
MLDVFNNEKYISCSLKPTSFVSSFKEGNKIWPGLEDNAKLYPLSIL